jgi:hypothetical protein
MRPDLDPAQMTPDERRREVAAILAFGLCRLRDRHALEARPEQTILESPSEAAKTPLEAAPENPLSVNVG